ncbi:hypothetical protein HanIR_Chr14g0691301 [Helianthus annuus]|nr:hypothetical protein HanIR_Chr14g0691301 [Helianthus annuus]
MLYQTTILKAESKGESEDELNAKGSVDSMSHVTIPEELVYGKQGVDPKARKLDERGSLMKKRVYRKEKLKLKTDPRGFCSNKRESTLMKTC